MTDAERLSAYPLLIAMLRLVVQAAHDEKVEDFSRVSNAADAAHDLHVVIPSVIRDGSASPSGFSPISPLLVLEVSVLVATGL